ncbi:MAG: hypothetical protein ACOYN0_12115 [Phycisphaerales bacterium]
MATFVVRGIDAQTGEPVALQITAARSRDARDTATKRGIVVSGVDTESGATIGASERNGAVEPDASLPAEPETTAGKKDWLSDVVSRLPLPLLYTLPLMVGVFPASLALFVGKSIWNVPHTTPAPHHNDITYFAHVWFISVVVSYTVPLNVLLWRLGWRSWLINPIGALLSTYCDGIQAEPWRRHGAAIMIGVVAGPSLCAGLLLIP